MSDLSRLRARWERIEKRIARLDLEIADADEDEVPALVEKRQLYVVKLDQVRERTHREELRLLSPTAKLQSSPVSMLYDI